MKRKITLFALIATGILAVCILSQAKDSSYDWETLPRSTTWHGLNK